MGRRYRQNHWSLKVVQLIKKLYAPIFLMVMVIFDSIATFVFWHKGWIEEENPFMLWALQYWWLYWLIKVVQVLLVVALGYCCTIKKGAIVVTWVVGGLFFLVWFQFLIGSLL